MLDITQVKGDSIIFFAGKIEKFSHQIEAWWEPMSRSSKWKITFTDGSVMTSEDPLVAIAEIKKPELPAKLNHYSLIGDEYAERTETGYYTAEEILRWLKADVAMLEAAGVKPE